MLVKETVGNTLELTGIGNNFLNRTPVTHKLKEMFDIWNYMKLKSFCTTKEMLTRLKRQTTK
jgi:hypothetical protein